MPKNTESTKHKNESDKHQKSEDKSAIDSKGKAQPQQKGQKNRANEKSE